MDQTERKKDPNGSWKRAQAQASEIKQERDMAVAQNTSDKGDEWEVISLRKAESVAPLARMDRGQPHPSRRSAHASLSDPEACRVRETGVARSLPPAAPP